jgi:hypothetical protein
MPHRSPGPLLIVLFMLSLSLPARGAEPLAPSLPSGRLNERLAFLTQRLDADRWHADHWRRGWIAIYLGAAVTNAALFANTSGWSARGSFGVEAVKASAGLIGHVLLQPFSAHRGADELRALRGSSFADLHAKVQAGERLLARNAREAGMRYAWHRHLAAVLVNVAGVLVVGLACDDWTTALINGGVGLAVGEAEIWSQPWRPRRDLDDYLWRFGVSAE